MPHLAVRGARRTTICAAARTTLQGRRGSSAAVEGTHGNIYRVFPGGDAHAAGLYLRAHSRTHALTHELTHARTCARAHARTRPFEAMKCCPCTPYCRDWLTHNMITPSCLCGSQSQPSQCQLSSQRRTAEQECAGRQQRGNGRPPGFLTALKCMQCRFLCHSSSEVGTTTWWPHAARTQHARTAASRHDGRAAGCPRRRMRRAPAACSRITRPRHAAATRSRSGAPVPAQPAHRLSPPVPPDQRARGCG